MMDSFTKIHEDSIRTPEGHGVLSPGNLALCTVGQPPRCRASLDPSRKLG